jgi:flagellar hook assembly protein FlgD
LDPENWILKESAPSEVPTLPTDIVLSQNIPNPFNQSTRMAFSLPQAAPVTISIFDILGRHVRTIISQHPFSEGSHYLSWDGRNENGNTVAAGLYFYMLQSLGHVLSAKMVFLK